MLIIIGLVVISLASFTDALTKLLSVFPDIRQTVVTGQWQSDVLKDARTGREYRYSFSLKSDGSRLYGSAFRLVPYCEEHKSAGQCEGYGQPVPILDGKLERKAISFLCDWGELPGASPWTWIKTKETFRGVVEGSKIRFVQQDDHNSPTVEFTATHVAKAASGGGL